MNALMEIDSAASIHQSPTFPSPSGRGVRGEGQTITGDAVAIPSALFEIPVDDSAEFMTLPGEVRRSVQRWLSACEYIASAPRVRPACRYVANHLLAGLKGASPSRVATRFYDYMRARDWRVLVDWAKAGPTARGDNNYLPADFVQFWKQLCEQNQRCDKAAHRELKHIYRTHFASARSGESPKEYKSIPGYTTWPEADEMTGLPKGWSYSNLTRYSPDPFEKKVARIGKAAAAPFKKQVFTSRVGLRFGQYIMFDDQEYDIKVNFLSRAGSATRKAMRPLGFNALELLTASCFAQSFKPTTLAEPDEQGAGHDRKIKLKEKDFLWFVVHVLTTFGYRADSIGTRLILERGTAAIRNQQIISRLETLTAGRVTIDTSGVDTAPAFAGLFESAAKGNFKFKAALESFFNLVRNEFAMLPGQVGKDRDHSPAELTGRDRYNEQILKLAAALPPERAQLLKFPFLEWTQFTGLALDIYRLIDTRTDHQLEGWQQLGFVSNEWRLPQIAGGGRDAAPPASASSSWLPMSDFLAMPAEAQLALRALIDRDPRLTRSRQLSPREAFEHSRAADLAAGAIARLPEYMILDLLEDVLDATELAERTVRGRYIEFDDQTLDPDGLRFDATLADGHRLRHGSKYLTLVNPFNPGHLHLFNARRAYIGAIPRDYAPCRADLDAVRRKMGEARADESARLQEIGLRHIDTARAKTEMHQHNARVASGAPITPEEKQRATTARDAARFGRELECAEGRDAAPPASVEVVDLT
jgi:hypothetical protein